MCACYEINVDGLLLAKKRSWLPQFPGTAVTRCSNRPCSGAVPDETCYNACASSLLRSLVPSWRGQGGARASAHAILNPQDSESNSHVKVAVLVPIQSEDGRGKHLVSSNCLSLMCLVLQSEPPALQTTGYQHN